MMVNNSQMILKIINVLPTGECTVILIKFDQQNNNYN